MWIKLTMRNPFVGDGKILVNTDNVSCVMVGQSKSYAGETLVCFSGDKQDYVPVEESVDEIESIIGKGLAEGSEDHDD